MREGGGGGSPPGEGALTPGSDEGVTLGRLPEAGVGVGEQEAEE